MIEEPTEEGGGDEPEYGPEDQYVDDLQSAMDSGDGRALYDAICAVIDHHGAGGSEEKAPEKPPLGKLRLKLAMGAKK